MVSAVWRHLSWDGAHSEYFHPTNYVRGNHHSERDKRPACVNYILFVVHMGWGCVQGHCTCSEVKLIIRVLSYRGCAWLMAALTACRAQALYYHITLLPQSADFKENCLFGKVTKSSSKVSKLEHCVLSCHTKIKLTVALCFISFN